MSMYMAMISLHKIKWIMKFKLLTPNRDLKIKFNKTKNTLFIIYENYHTMREREREREREIIITKGVKMVPTCISQISRRVRIKLNDFFQLNWFFFFFFKQSGIILLLPIWLQTSLELKNFHNFLIW